MKTPKTNSTELFNKALKIFLAASGVILTILHFVDPIKFPKIGSYLAEIGLPFAVDFLRLFNIKFSNRFQLAYCLFLVPSMLLGICFDWYKSLFIFGQPMFDKVAHTLSGVVAAFAAKELLEAYYEPIDKKKFKRGFSYLFIVCFVAFTAAAWECFEFLYDSFCGGSMQELIAPGVGDTMWDILGAMAAGVIAAYPLSKKQ